MAAASVMIVTGALKHSARSIVHSVRRREWRWVVGVAAVVAMREKRMRREKKRVQTRTTLWVLCLSAMAENRDPAGRLTHGRREAMRPMLVSSSPERRKMRLRNGFSEEAEAK